MKSLYIYILLVFSLLSCTEEIPLQTNFKAQTIINGIISNLNQQVVITVQESVPVDAIQPSFINDANISLFTKDPNGNILLVTNEFEVTNGTYTSFESINSIIGNYYWIEVELSNGSSYKSAEEELLKAPVPINNISSENNATRVSFSDPVEDTNFYRLATIFHDNNQDHVIYELSNDVLFNGNDDAFIETETLYNGDVNAALANINYNTYQYYINLQEQQFATEDEEDSGPGQLFASPPISLTGNILNTSTNEKALGNFGVLSISFY